MKMERSPSLGSVGQAKPAREIWILLDGRITPAGEEARKVFSAHPEYRPSADAQKAPSRIDGKRTLLGY